MWLAAAAASALKYFESVIFSSFLNSLLLAVVLLISLGLGRKTLSLFRLEPPDSLGKNALALSLGLGILCYVVLGLGALKVLYPWAASGALIFLGALVYPEIKQGVLEFKLPFSSASSDIEKLCFLGAGACLLLGFLCTFAPPHQYDSLVYHLALAQNHVRTHSISHIPQLIYSHFPQNGEMLFTLSLLLGSDILAQMLTWSAFVLTLFLTYGFGRRHLGAKASALALVLFSFHPSSLALSSTTYVESWVTLWTAASVFLFLEWRLRPLSSESFSSELFLSGIFAGLGLGTKYIAGISPAILSALILSRFREAKREDKTRALLFQAGFFVLACALPYLPWAVKNILQTGNPFYPFFAGVFPFTGSQREALGALNYFQVLGKYGHAGDFLKNLILFPYTLFTRPVYFGGGADVLGGMGWEIFLFLIPLMVWASRENRRLRLLGIYALAHWFAWFSTAFVTRFLVVLAPFLSLLSAEGLRMLEEKMQQPGRWVLRSGLAAFLLLGLALFFYVHQVFETPKVLLGLESRSEYLNRRLLYYPCAQYSGRFLQAQDKVLLLGEQRSYYLNRENLPTSLFYPNSFLEQADSSNDWAELASSLKTENFTHILFVPKEAERLFGPNMKLTEKGIKNWKDLQQKGLEPVYGSAGCVLYEIKERIR